MKLKLFLFFLCLVAFCAVGLAQTKTTFNAETKQYKVEKVVFKSEQEVVNHFKLIKDESTIVLDFNSPKQRELIVYKKLNKKGVETLYYIDKKKDGTFIRKKIPLPTK